MLRLFFFQRIIRLDSLNTIFFIHFFSSNLVPKIDLEFVPPYAECISLICDYLHPAIRARPFIQVKYNSHGLNDVYVTRL